VKEETDKAYAESPWDQALFVLSFFFENVLVLPWRGIIFRILLI
jgi:hypothetical protein